MRLLINNMSQFFLYDFPVDQHLRKSVLRHNGLHRSVSQKDHQASVVQNLEHSLLRVCDGEIDVSIDHQSHVVLGEQSLQPDVDHLSSHVHGDDFLGVWVERVQAWRELLGELPELCFEADVALLDCDDRTAAAASADALHDFDLLAATYKAVFVAVGLVWIFEVFDQIAIVQGHYLLVLLVGALGDEVVLWLISEICLHLGYFMNL
jgi:hypothetical protein